MQGPVYGIITQDTRDNDDLFPFFYYDGLFGTVLNRFIVQAVAAGCPLTVYGKGGKTRGYLNIKDTLNCISLSLENPVQRGVLRIFNQFAKTFTVNELVQKEQRAGKKLALNVTVRPVENPRIKVEEHYYNPEYTGLLAFGLQPTYLTDAVLVHMMQTGLRRKAKIENQQIYRKVTRPERLFVHIKWQICFLN